MPRARTVPAIDEHYATEIRLFLDNDRALYDQKVKAFLPNIARKMISGKYDASKTWKLWMYLVDEAVRKYDVEHGSGGHRVQRGWGTVRVGSLAAVNKPTREAIARELAADEEAALRGGEYGDLYTVAGRKPPKAAGVRSNPAWRKVGASGWQAKTAAGTIGVTYSAGAGGYFGSTSKGDGPILPTRQQAQAWAEQATGARSNPRAKTYEVFAHTGETVWTGTAASPEAAMRKFKQARGLGGALFTGAYGVRSVRGARKNAGARRNTSKPTSVIVRANLWRDSAGNTYHKAYVSVDGKHVLTTPVTYGYGNHFEHTAYEALVAKGLVRPLKRHASGGEEAPWRAYQEQGIAHEGSYTRVSRKRDL